MILYHPTEQLIVRKLKNHKMIEIIKIRKTSSHSSGGCVKISFKTQV